jgi:glycosyltransferase involved in cell wall biosynthesis
MINSSGIGVYIRNISKGFKEFEIIKRIINKEQLNVGINYIDIINESQIYSLTEQLWLPILIPKCDVFLSPHYNIPVLPIRAKRRLVTIHDVFHIAFFSDLKFIQKIYAYLMINAAVRLSDKIITVSNFSKQEIIKFTNVSPNKIEVIHNGVDHNKFKLLSQNNSLEVVRKKYGLPEKFLLFVGNVKPHKNLVGLIKAFGKSKKLKTDFELVIVGKKDGFITSETNLDYLIKEFNLVKTIHFTGFVDDEDLPHIYNLASWFVFPSRYEGFGLPPLEAMACGCPVIASDIPVFNELFEDAFHAVNTVNIEIFAQKLESAVFNEELRNSLIKKGFQQSKKFTWEKSWNKHRQLIQNLIS